MPSPARSLVGALAASALLVLLSGAPAHAFGDCAEPYTAAQVQEDLGSMTVALRELDEAAFNAAGLRMDAGLPCLDSALPVAAYATAYRLLGSWRYITGDQDIATRWFRTAIEVDGSFAWDVNDLPEGHPMRRAYDGERAIAAQAPVAVRDMVLDAPSEAEVLVDGRPLTAPALTTGRPHLIQVVDSQTREVRQGWMIDGNAIPSEIMITQAEADARAQALAEAEGKGKKKDKSKTQAVSSTTVSETDVFAVQTVKRTRPLAKTPLLLTGAAGIVASGVIYGMTFPAHQKFEDATTTNGLLTAQTATNTLVIAAGATLAVSAGLGIVGIRLDSSPGLVLGRRF